MVTTVAQIGPFTGGLNKASDASAIADNEVSKLINFNVDLDGSLVCRPPIGQVALDFNNVDSVMPFGFGRILIIGSVNIGGTPFLIGSTEHHGIWSFFASSKDSEGHEVFTANQLHPYLRSDCAIQLHNVVFILAREDSPVGNAIWDGYGTGLVTTDDGPRGSVVLFFKGRLWVTPGAYADTNLPASSQLKFSDPVSNVLPLDVVWPPENLIPVGQGDGQNLIDMLVVADNLMLFKNNSTYSYLYDVSPNEGILRKVNNNIGVSAQFCALTHQNEAYVYHEGNVYQISNYTFVEASIKLPFERVMLFDSRREKVCMSLVGDFILMRYFDELYALNLQTKTWSEWQSANGSLDNFGRMVKYETNLVSSELEGYYGGSVILSDSSLMRIKPGHNNYDSEYVQTGLITDELPPTQIPIECVMTTKIFDFNASHVFKRLMWWGVDVISDGHVVGTVKPVRQTKPYTWEDISSYTWEQLYAWDNLLQAVGYVETDVDDLFVLRRKFIKLLKSLRFRQVSFTVKLVSDGKIAPEETLGPARLFSLSAMLGLKQTVVKQVE